MFSWLVEVAHPALFLPLASTPSDPVTFLINYGVAGIVLVLIVTGRVRTRAEVDGLTQALKDAIERERVKDAALQSLMNQITTSMVPQLGHLAQVVEQLPQQSQVDLQALVRRLEAKIESIEQGHS